MNQTIRLLEASKRMKDLQAAFDQAQAQLTIATQRFDAIKLFQTIQNELFKADPKASMSGCDSKGKVNRLVCRFQDMKVPAQPIGVVVKWDDLPLPQDLLKHAPTEPRHSWSARITLLGLAQSIDLDPTFDPGLAKAGFPIADFDGVNSTIRAFAASPLLSREESRVIWEREVTMPERERHAFAIKYQSFYRDLNDWIVELRRPPARESHPLEELHA